MSEEKTTKKEMLQNALSVAGKLLEDGSYRGSRRSALTALTKRCVGWKREELEPFFEEAIELHGKCFAFYRANLDKIVKLSLKDQNYDSFALEFYEQNKPFPKEVIEARIWNFYCAKYLR